MVLLLFLVIALLAIATRLYLLTDSQQVATTQYANTHDVTLDTLLDVEEVRLTALTAYIYDTPSELIPLQAKLLDTAKQLSMSSADIAFINSPRLLTYLKFRAARECFEFAVDEAYQNLGVFASVKVQYPEASDLFASAEALFVKRDAILQDIALEIAEQEQQTLHHTHIEKAQAIWLARANRNIAHPCKTSTR